MKKKSLFLNSLHFLSFIFVIPCICLAEKSDPYYFSYLQTPLTLSPPQKGSLIGEYASFNIQNSNLTKGTFHLNLPFDFPKERGGLLIALSPSYSPSNGLSEWGMGISLTPMIYRWNENGSIDFKTDSLITPWGEFVQGDDDWWYCKGFTNRTRLRIKKENQFIEVFLSEGIKLIFGKKIRIESKNGVYAWYIEEASSLKGEKNLFKYETNLSGRPFLKRVFYGGRGEQFQYRIDFNYKALLHQLFVDYRSSKKIVLDQRVKKVDLFIRSDKGDHFIFKESYDLIFGDEDQSIQNYGPQFFLTQIHRQTFKGEKFPPVFLQYNSALETLNHAKWEDFFSQNSSAPTPLFDFFDEEKISSFDFLTDGSVSVENSSNYTTYSFSKNEEIIQTPLEDINPQVRDPLCRKENGSDTARKLIKVRGYLDEHIVYAHHIDENDQRMVLHFCTRKGESLSKIKLPQGWWDGNFTRLVDLNNDGRPDLIQLTGDRYKILKNISTSQEILFDEKNIIEGRFKRKIDGEQLLFHDINGDGIMDLIIVEEGGIKVVFGKGNFEFEDDYIYMPFYGITGRLNDFHRARLQFADINRDGLADIFIQSEDSELYMMKNMGNSFQRHAIFSEYSNILVGKIGQNFLSDFKGEGFLQLVRKNFRGVKKMKLNTPGVGLLRHFDDGLGNQIDFDYAYVEREKGAEQVVLSLKSLKKNSFGLGEVKIDFQYSGINKNLKNRLFEGFSHIKKISGPLTEQLQYVYPDNALALCVSELKNDSRLPQFTYFKNYNYVRDPYLTFGIISYPLLSTEEGFQNQTLKSHQYSYDLNNLCLSSIEEITQNKLVMEKNVEVLQEHPEFLTCLDKTIHFKGIHDDPSLNFHHTLAFTHNSQGLITEISNGSLSLQRMSYDQDSLIKEIYSAGKGSIHLEYDSLFRLLAIRQPNDVKLIAEYDIFSDKVSQLKTIRGNLFSHDQNYIFDSFGRLVGEWDNFNRPNGSDSKKPFATYSYRWPTQNNPATIDVVKDFLLLQSVEKNTMYLNARGDTLATVQHTDNQPVVLENKRYFPQTKEIFSYPAFNSEVDYQKILINQQKVPWLSHQEESFLNLSLKNENLVGQNIIQKNNYRYILPSSGSLHFTQEKIENEREDFIQMRTLNANNHPLSFRDEENFEWNYTNDALGRLRQIQLPGGELHQVTYNSLGQIEKIYRSDWGQFLFQYEEKTSLLSSKETYSLQNNELFYKTQYSYNPAGELIYQIDNDVKNQKQIETQFTYTPPYGFVSSIHNNFYHKEFSYRADGALKESTISFHSLKGPTITIAKNYGEEKRIKEITIEDKLQSLQIAYLYNSWGKVQELTISTGKDKKILQKISYNYNHLGKISDIQLDKTEYSFLYELDTGKYSGYKTSENFLYEFFYNQRGLIDREIFSSRERSYEYSPRGFVSKNLDSKLPSFENEEFFSYDANGLISNNELTHEIQYDRLNRLSKKDKRSYFYGPNNRLTSVVNSDDGKILAEYGYDHEGKILFKSKNNEIVEVYFDWGLWTKEEGFIYKLQVEDKTYALFFQDTIHPNLFDLRDSYIEKDQNNDLTSFAGVYGKRMGEQNNLTKNKSLFFAHLGYDNDAQLIRAGHRFYNPEEKKFVSADPLFLENPEKCVESPVECNLYSYAGNNPTSNVDFGGLLTVIINGTFASHADWAQPNSPFSNAVGRTYGETPVAFSWSGDNNRGARTVGANQLMEFIRNHNFSSGEKLNIVAHSHGGNVVKEYTHLNGAHSIDNLVNLATPQRDDYIINTSKVVNYMNVFSNSDYVQQNLGGGLFHGLPGREDTAAHSNVSLNINGEGLCGTHCSIHTPEAWQAIQSSTTE